MRESVRENGIISIITELTPGLVDTEPSNESLDTFLGVFGEQICIENGYYTSKRSNLRSPPCLNQTLKSLVRVLMRKTQYCNILYILLISKIIIYQIPE